MKHGSRSRKRIKYHRLIKDSQHHKNSDMGHFATTSQTPPRKSPSVILDTML